MRPILVIAVLLAVFAAGFFLVDGELPLIPLVRLFHHERTAGRGMEANEKGVRELAEGQDDLALASLRVADRLEPGNPVIRRNLSIALARAALQEGKEEREALDLLGESLALWPGNPEGLDGMSTVHLRNARYGEALEYARKLREVMPDRPDLDAFIEDLTERASLVEGMLAEEGDRFRLLYSGERRLQYEGEILSVLQTQMDALTAALGVFPDDPVDVLILTEDLGERADPFLPFANGLYDGQIRLYVGDGVGDREEFIGTVRHEMVHALLHHVSAGLPGWVHEGIAQKVGEDPSEEKIRQVRNYVRNALALGYGVNIEALGDSFVLLDEQERSRAYATSLLFLDWLEKTYGESFIPRFVWEISSGTDAPSAAGKIAGTPFEQIQVAFHKYLTEDR